MQASLGFIDGFLRSEAFVNYVKRIYFFIHCSLVCYLKFAKLLIYY